MHQRKRTVTILIFSSPDIEINKEMHREVASIAWKTKNPFKLLALNEQRKFNYEHIQLHCPFDSERTAGFKKVVRNLFVGGHLLVCFCPVASGTHSQKEPSHHRVLKHRLLEEL